MIQPFAKKKTNATQEQPHWLRPEDLAAISSLELRARGVVEGFLQGLHRSPFVGFSVEFSSHRKYAPGDDLRYLNWNIYAKQRRFYVKEFDAETNMNLYLLVDGSRSMQCHLGGALSKQEYASTLAAALALLAMQQRDAVGLGIASKGITDYLAPSARPSRWQECLALLSQPAEERSTELPKALEQAASLFNHRGIVILISDLVDDPDGIQEGLQMLRHRGHEVVVLQLLDPWERSLPESGRVKFTCLESNQEITANVESIRKNYQQKVDSWCAQLDEICRQQSIDRIEIDTEKSPTAALVDYLVLRTS